MSNVMPASKTCRRHWAVCFLALTTMFFLASGTAAQSKFSRAVMRPALWEKIRFKPKAACSIGLQDCAMRYLVDAGVKFESAPIYEFFTLGVSRRRNLTVAFVTQKVTDDDSLTGIRYRLVLSLRDVENLIREQTKRNDPARREAFLELIEERLAIMTLDGGLSDHEAESEVTNSLYYQHAIRWAANHLPS